MEDPKWDSKFFFDFLWNVMSLALIARAESEALQDALVEAGVLPRERFDQLVRMKRQAALDVIQRSAQSGESPWLELLKAFEGPVQ